jgi:GNAT superfamily N-acetyltransferase
VTDKQLDRMWSWVTDPDHDVKALLVRDPSGAPVGLAHYRPYYRPLAASVAGHLDDLYITPAARGTGAVDALLAALRGIARQHGWSKIRWITADDNYRARSKYDQVAERTTWITYDMQVPPAAAGSGG